MAFTANSLSVPGFNAMLFVSRERFEKNRCSVTYIHTYMIDHNTVKVTSNQVHNHSLLRQRVQYKLGVIVHQCLQNKAPQYLVDYCKRTSDVCSRQRLRSANRYQLIVPRHRHSMFGRRAFSVAGPMEWNSLPDSLRDPARSTDSFRSALKTHLLAVLRDD